MNENKNLKKGLGIHARRFIAYVVLILVTFACLFWFYVLFINATRSNGELQAGFTPLPSTHLLENWNESVTRNTSGMAGYDKQSDRIGTVSSVMHLFFNHDGLRHSCI